MNAFVTYSCLSVAMLLAGCAGGGSAAKAPSTSQQSTNSLAPSTSSTVHKSASATVPTIRSAYSVISVTQLPVWVANDLGLFNKYGVRVELSYISTGPTLLAGILSDNIQIGVSGETEPISARLGGSDIVMIASGPNRLVNMIYARPDIASLAGLKGKHLGVARPGSLTDFVARYVLSHNNLQPDKDVTLVNIGGQPEILAAIKSGAVDAGVLAPPATVSAQKQGLKDIFDISRSNIAYYPGVVIARKSWLDANKDAATAYIKAYIEAVSIIRRDPQRVVPILLKYTKTSDAKGARESIDTISRVLPLDQTPSLDAVKLGLEQAAATNPKAKQADQHQFIDTSVVTDINQSGFTKNLS